MVLYVNVEEEGFKGQEGTKDWLAAVLRTFLLVPACSELLPNCRLRSQGGVSGRQAGRWPDSQGMDPGSVPTDTLTLFFLSLVAGC